MDDKITISVNQELLKWVDEQIKNYRFGNRSHAFQYAINEIMNNT